MEHRVPGTDGGRVGADHRYRRGDHHGGHHHRPHRPHQSEIVGPSMPTVIGMAKGDPIVDICGCEKEQVGPGDRCGRCEPDPDSDAMLCRWGSDRVLTAQPS